MGRSCDNCKHVSRIKGIYLGSSEFWCSKQSGQKHKQYLCWLYEPDDTESESK